MFNVSSGWKTIHYTDEYGRHYQHGGQVYCQCCLEKEGFKVHRGEGDESQ